MNKKGNFSFKVIATSVSGIVAVIGAFVIWLSLQYNKPDLQTTGIKGSVEGNRWLELIKKSTSFDKQKNNNYYKDY